MTERDPDIDAMISLTAYHAAVPVRLLVARGQPGWAREVRRAAVWAIRSRSGATTRTIGAHVGGRSPQTIATDLIVAGGRYRNDTAFAGLVGRVLADFDGSADQ